MAKTDVKIPRDMATCETGQGNYVNQQHYVMSNLAFNHGGTPQKLSQHQQLECFPLTAAITWVAMIEGMVVVGLCLLFVRT